MQIVPRRRFTRTNAAVTVVLLYGCLSFIVSAMANENFGWPIVFHYFFSGAILGGLLTTILLTIAVVVLGLAVGILVALMHISESPLLSGFARIYVWFFRGTPLLVQIIFWFNLAALYPTLSVSLLFLPSFAAVNTTALITPFMAALLGMGLHASGYMAEVVRGGILGVDHTQAEAAMALGMTSYTRYRRVILPQALRIIIPTLANRVIAELKDTSLVSVIAIPDLLYSAQIIYSRTYETIPLLITATLWYLIAVTVLMLVQRVIERRLKSSLTGR